MSSGNNNTKKNSNSKTKVKTNQAKKTNTTKKSSSNTKVNKPNLPTKKPNSTSKKTPSKSNNGVKKNTSVNKSSTIKKTTTKKGVNSKTNKVSTNKNTVKTKSVNNSINKNLKSKAIEEPKKEVIEQEKPVIKNTKKIDLFLFSFLSILYVEFVFRIATVNTFCTSSLFYIFLSTLLISFFLYFVSSLFSAKVGKIVYRILLFITSFYGMAMIIYKKIFNVYFSLVMLKIADQVMSFWQDALVLISKYLIFIFFLLIPFVLTFIMNKRIEYKRIERKKVFLGLGIMILIILAFKISLFIFKDKSYSSYEIYYKINDTSLAAEKFGVFISGYLDVKKMVTGFEEEVNLVKKKVTTKQFVYDYNNLDIDFESLINNTDDETVKQMHEYFSNEEGTLQNEYTGMFEGKNLILFMAESFNEIAVDKKLTPTLYKLTHSSFIFDNFYTPVNNSTIGGEFQEITGLYAVNSVFKIWRSGSNYFPMGLGTVFKDLGYTTYAYHDHSYTFQDRDKYLKALGFNNFKGCFNGLEKKINCKIWPESDVDMINATIDDYIDDDKFMVFYASVSGHGDYGWTNAMSAKHKDEVNDLPYSTPAKAYLAAQIEFDKALELLLQKLEEKGKLEDTVIAFVGDHYPYMLKYENVTELAPNRNNDEIDINSSYFGLYNSQVDDIHISKVGNQIDVLPTIYNLFGIKYDSRLIIGKDILSSEPGLAIFNTRSWVSDYGKYYATSKTFVLNDGMQVPDDYVDTTNREVSNKINMSKLIIETDYYRKVLGN